MRQGLRAARGRPGRAYHSVLRCDGAGWPAGRHRRQRRRPAGAPLTTPLWTGLVKLPAIRTPGHLSILAAEQELLPSDAVKEYIAVDSRGPGIPVGGPTFYRPGSRRLVFAEDSSP